MNIKVGCCGFTVARWKYYGQFNVVELQQTFYQIPQFKTAHKWRLGAPGSFEFTLKAWQLITHEASSPTYNKLASPIAPTKKRKYGAFKPTAEVQEAWEKTEKVADILKAKAIIFQCPVSFLPSDENKENLRRFFMGINRKNYQLIWEPRGKWSSSEVFDLCQELGLIYALDPFQTPPEGKRSVNYFRLHGRNGYRYKYTDADLEKLAAFLSGDEANYVMFNNMSMFEDAMRLKEILLLHNEI